MAEIKTAGLIMYRMKEGKPEIFLVHNGGPYYAKKEDQAWSFPKGGARDGENLLEAAKREFKEETSFDVPDVNFIELPPLKASPKIVYMWAFKGDCDPTKMKSNMCMVEWPPRSGKQIEIPEVDRGAFFDLDTARKRIFKYLVPIIDMFEQKIS
jgi:predicted NUDIX family NTP pyrophosphohydrolase